MKKNIIVVLLGISLFIPHSAQAKVKKSTGGVRIKKMVRNITQGGGFAANIKAETGDEIEVRITARASKNIEGLRIRDEFDPEVLEYEPGSLEVNGDTGLTGLTSQFGLLFYDSATQVITYKATVADGVEGDYDPTATAQISNKSSESKIVISITQTEDEGEDESGDEEMDVEDSHDGHSH